ncbi:MAG: hypothetical protein HC933_05540 [Pleurocapsa sp. SU_196_0]|nr:hypothetical protein [Pleurocapsa sp. SU_196_0]
MAQDELPTIEEHAQTANLESWVLPGAMRRNNWAQQQRVTSSDFDAGVKRFLRGGTAGEEPTPEKPAKAATTKATDGKEGAK